MLPEGTILKEKYLVGRYIGNGGFGITYLGMDQVLDIKVAIKEYYPASICYRSTGTKDVKPSNEGFREGFIKGRNTFLNEARSLAMFNSPDIVRVRDFFPENNTSYIVMDYVEGTELSDEIRMNGGRLPWHRVYDLMMDLLPELDKIHRKKLVHRDIKPANLKVEWDPNSGKDHLVLLDFGAARIFTSTEVSGDYTMILTPGYAPIEQYRRHSRQGPYTDVYALCATMYEMLTGKIPPSALERIGNSRMTSVKELVPDVPESMDRAVMWGLSKEIEDRPQNMRELYKALALPQSVSVEDNTIALKYCYNCMELIAETCKICPHCGQSNAVTLLVDSLNPGTILSQKYLIGKTLRRDVFGNTYIGADLLENRKITVKEYFPENVSHRKEDGSGLVYISPEFVEDYRKEVYAFIAELEKHETMTSPYIAYSRDHFVENGTLYIITDYVDGESLAERLKRSSVRLPWNAALQMMLPLVLELDRLHNNGFYHGKIDPDHLMLTGPSKNMLKLVDFFFHSSVAVSRSDSVGSSPYMPIETYMSKQMEGFWTDVYSVCAVLYRLISGAEIAAAPERRERYSSIEPFVSFGIRVPQYVEEAIFHGLELSPSDRTRTMRDLYDELTNSSASG